jgi:hypothetical protein
MNVDLDRLKRVAPFALPVAIVVVGWMAVIRPVAADGAAAAGRTDTLRQRLAQVRASVAQPPPPPTSDDPLAAFELQVADHDVSAQVVGQLADLAKVASATGLVIETGDRVVVSAPGGPQVSDGGAPPDPRFALFQATLAYVPISMSFDARFASAGRFLWELRDVATTIEIRSLEIRPRAGEEPAGAAAADGEVHVALTLFAYAREDAAVAAAVGRP